MIRASPVTDVETYALFACYGYGFHHPFNFGRTSDDADTHGALVSVASHEPVLRLYQALWAVGGLKRTESIRCRGNQRGRVRAALCKVQEWAFGMPTQQMCSTPRRPWSQETEELWVEQLFLGLEWDSIRGQSRHEIRPSTYDNRRNEGCDTRLRNPFCDQLEAIAVCLVIAFVYRKVETKSTIDLNVNIPWTGVAVSSDSERQQGATGTLECSRLDR